MSNPVREVIGTVVSYWRETAETDGYLMATIEVVAILIICAMIFPFGREEVEHDTDWIDEMWMEDRLDE